MFTLSSRLSIVDSQWLMQSLSWMLFFPQSYVSSSTVSRYRIPMSRMYLDTGFEADLGAGLSNADPISVSAMSAIIAAAFVAFTERNYRTRSVPLSRTARSCLTQAETQHKRDSAVVDARPKPGNHHGTRCASSMGSVPNCTVSARPSVRSMYAGPTVQPAP